MKLILGGALFTLMFVYDFHLNTADTLTIAVGDATGHGLKAGTMVTAVKGLFDTLAYHPDIPHIFERLTRTLKRMNLRGLFMAMTIVKINQHRLVVSIAGMPPQRLAEIGQGSAQEILNHLVALGEDWGGAHPPDDDVTFVVVKVK